MKLTITIRVDDLRGDTMERLQSLVCDLRAQGLEVNVTLNENVIHFFCNGDLNDGDFRSK